MMCFAAVAGGSMAGFLAAQIYQKQIEIFYLELIENEINSLIFKLKSNDRFILLISELVQILDEFSVQIRDELEKHFINKVLSKPYSFEQVFEELIDNLKKIFLKSKTFIIF